MSVSERRHATWYQDAEAAAQGIPSMVHSYVAAAATAINAQEGSVDLVWLAGATAFAFRIWVHKELCPSATSVIDWFMPVVSLRQAGWSAEFYSRLWWEGNLEEERREQANAACRDALAVGRLPVCWDICFEPEWAVIDALNDDGTYACVAAGGRTTSFDPTKMGRRAVEIMSVTVIGERSLEPWDRDAVVASLRSAVNHARQGEWEDRPAYQDGLPAFEQWARGLEQLSSKPDWRDDSADSSAVRYNAGTYYAARNLARRYLEHSAAMGWTPEGVASLQAAALAYATVEVELRALWCWTQSGSADLAAAAAMVRRAGMAEAEGIDFIASFNKSL